jgi:hypothetical protein
MEKYSVERIDHLGIVAGTIKDLGLVELIDSHLGHYKDETLSAGETVAGMRNRLAEQQETVPNQINQPTQTPTLRWIFQLMGGISRIKITVGNRVKYVFDGITKLKKRILLLFGDGVANIYQIS